MRQAGSYYSNTGAVVPKIISSGLGINMALEMGMDSVLSSISKNKRHWWLPGLKIESGYSDYTQNINSITGFHFATGFVWKLPLSTITSLFRYHKGKFSAGILPLGISILKITGFNHKGESTSYSFFSHLGYEYILRSNIAVFLHARQGYVYDKTDSLINLGFSLGLSYGL